MNGREAGATRHRLLTGLLIGVAVPAAGTMPVGAQTVAAEVATEVAAIRATGRMHVGGTQVQVPAPVLDLYERRGHVPVWDAASAAELLAFLRGLRGDGLVPEHYEVDALAAPAAASLRPAALDVLRTAMLAHAAYDLRFGRIDQTTLRRRSFGGALSGTDATAALAALLPPAGGPAAWRSLPPTGYVYTGMRRALAELREVEADGGWLALGPGPRLETGVDDPRVARLRVRLAIAGDLPRSAVGPTLFDDGLDAAVRSFQHRHGLNADGVVGPATLRELDVPVAARIAQLRINLERARWLGDVVAPTFVVVNAAGALVYLIVDGEIVFEERAIVGQTATRTPTFTASMRHIEVNPTWTVPPGIVGEVLTRARRDPRYLQTNGIRVLDAQGRVVDAGAVDFRRYTARSFPFTFRQDAGPANPLGVVKFVFPNPYHVYLHDTPARELFAREQRTFSHGCIRVQNPLRLAELLLEAHPTWNAASLRDAVDAGVTRVIPLPAPVPVLILYWTAATDMHGELHFHPDIYGRDAPLLRALDGR